MQALRKLNPCTENTQRVHYCCTNICISQMHPRTFYVCNFEDSNFRDFELVSFRTIIVFVVIARARGAKVCVYFDEQQWARSKYQIYWQTKGCCISTLIVMWFPLFFSFSLALESSRMRICRAIRKFVFYSRSVIQLVIAFQAPSLSQ